MVMELLSYGINKIDICVGPKYPVRVDIINTLRPRQNAAIFQTTYLNAFF